MALSALSCKMICLRRIKRLCHKMAKYMSLIIIAASSITLTTLIVHHKLLSRDKLILPINIKVRQDESEASVTRGSVNWLNNLFSIKHSNKQKEPSQFSDYQQHHDLNSELKQITPTEDGAELLTRYNVTPDLKWLQTFYKIDSSKKVKTSFDFPFIIQASEICSTIREPFLVILVPSVHSHIGNREAIRNTWGRSANPGDWPGVGDLRHKVVLVFLFGKGRTFLKNNLIRIESETYHDIVQADFEDSYFNLTYKVITGIRWVTQFCSGAKYILKADEDVFVHVHNLIEMLKNVPQTETATFYGHTQETAPVLRTGRWNVAPKSFPFPVYPTYTCGNTYVVPGSKAMEIYKTARYLDYMNIEDVFVTGILRIIIGAKIRNVVGFTNWYENKPTPCDFINVIRISATKVTEDVQYDIWDELSDNKSNCIKEILY